MDTNQEKIRDQQRASWDKFSPGWKKWDTLMMDFMQPVADEIINAVQPGGEHVVLDVASGTGEPGLTIASMLNGGKVFIADLSDSMLDVARENARGRGITNVEMVACDVCDMPFADNTFDAISCRYGFMFFPDMELAIREMVRVLKPGGRIATAVWAGPQGNFWITACMSTINGIMDLPQPPAGAPGMFRCAQPGMIAEMFRTAGLNNVVEQDVHSLLKCGTAETYWGMMTEVAAPVVSAMNSASEEIKTRIQNEVLARVRDAYPSNSIAIAAHTILIHGEKKA